MDREPAVRDRGIVLTDRGAVEIVIVNRDRDLETWRDHGDLGSPNYVYIVHTICIYIYIYMHIYIQNPYMGPGPGPCKVF